MKNAEQEMEEEQLNHLQSMGAGSQSQQKSEKSHTENGYKDFIKTLITFNKGGDWRRIRAPERDIDGKRYDCGEYCFLNLFGISSEYPPYYSVDSAAGIILANGNVGRYLSHDNESVATFLTRDGGLNWFEIRKGSHIYEIGDHGALIVIADDQNPTKEIFYSWDEGMTFEPLKISEEKFLIKNIIIEPTSTSQHFVVYGESHRKGDSKGIVIGVDFTGLHEPQCRNPDKPGSSDSDYETWSPNDGRTGRECLMGHKTIYVRRKREVQCYNGLLFERKTIVEHCECVEDDYECDFGFARASPGEPCVSITNGKKGVYSAGPEMVYPAPADCNEFYTISRGYRKVPGNTCIKGIRFDPIVIPCPYNGVFARVGGVFFVIIIASLIVVAVLFVLNKGLAGLISELIFGASAEQHARQKNTVFTNKRDYVNIVS